MVIPQALRIIIPPLTSQYLNLTKNSSLGRGDRLSRPLRDRRHDPEPDRPGDRDRRRSSWWFTCRISLLTSLFMNWFNTKMALKER